jgi:hypothetical protein
MRQATLGIRHRVKTNKNKKTNKQTNKQQQIKEREKRNTEN